MELSHFHPATAAWFEKTFAAPTDAQSLAWPSIKEGRHTLIAAPTGSGKTLSAFLSAIDDLVRLGVRGELEDTTHVVYVSPLKALSNDIRRNLEQPLEGIRRELVSRLYGDIEIRVLVRTGDTPASERARMVRRPPHIVVTTPESLFLLLTSESGRRMLSTTRTLILDEIHALVGDRRGAHLVLSVERLERLVSRPLVRIGLSATQRPIESVARFLVGSRNLRPHDSPDCTIIDTGHARKLDLAIEVPGDPLESVMSNETWEEIYDRIANLILEHRTTLVFVNTRRMAERVSRHLGERLGEENVTSHHGSLSRERRLEAEKRLKAGELRALVATASLELGIDIGAVELVCQIGSTRSISTLLQRVGRSGHWVGGVPKGRLFPTTRDELVECAALLDSVRRGELDRLSVPANPLDVLAQQIVAAAACEDLSEDQLYGLITGAYPYRELPREDFDSVVEMLANGFTTRRGRRGALVHRDGVNGRVRGRKAARITAITNAGAIPDNADYDVVLEPEGAFIGTVNEDFAVESMAGDIFQLGNASWRILRVERGRVRVEDARGMPPTIPFWLGEARARSDELSRSVSRLREELENRLDSDQSGAATEWLVEEVGLSRAAAVQIIEYLAAVKAALGVVPTQETIVFERFFDESGGTQLVIHSPFGGRINRAWGLALRKRFCRKFNFELQAAATEDSIVLSLGAAHSFPTEEVFEYLKSSSVRDILTQALLDAPMFAVRWRWVVARALAVLRRRGGKKIPPQLQRMDAEDLLTVVFPDQLACAENLTGAREIPDHPLVNQAIRDCLEEAMDIEGLERLLSRVEQGRVNMLARDLAEPSLLAHEILNARPYAFLDDAPLEERRTQAVMGRRWMTPESAEELGRLDAGAIQRVREEAWPQVDNPDELHDALMQLGFVTEEEGASGEPPGVVREVPESGQTGWRPFFDELVGTGRAGVMSLDPDGPRLWVATERAGELLETFPEAAFQPENLPNWDSGRRGDCSTLVEIFRGRLEALGPVTAEMLARAPGIPPGRVSTALGALEAEGFVMRGRFTPGASEVEWCARRLLARIHGYTLNRLRKEIEPVNSADFMRFLFDWQRVTPDHQVDGPEGLAAVLEQIEGFEAAASAWEGDILPARIPEYDPAWLDSLCLSGRVVWLRLTPSRSDGDRPKAGPIRTTPISLLQRTNRMHWDSTPDNVASCDKTLSSGARQVLDFVTANGASFFPDIVSGARLLRAQVEEALGELVSWGLVTSDSFTGLRALLTPSSRRPDGPASRRRSTAPFGMEQAGRWSRIQRTEHVKTAFEPDSEQVEKVARTLLRRYGVVFRKLLDRETVPVPWRDLLRVYRRLEARGEIRGGRFVAGHSGEQFALPDAVASLRAVRRKAGTEQLVSISAADPLNLIGILTPGARVAPFASNRILFQDGVAIALFESKEVRYLSQPAAGTEWRIRNALIQRNVPPELRAYLGNAG